MTQVYRTYADVLAAANKRASELGIEVAIRQMDDGTYRIQQRHEYMTDGKLIAIARPV
jgi:hypothetical protein